MIKPRKRLLLLPALLVLDACSKPVAGPPGASPGGTTGGAATNATVQASASSGDAAKTANLPQLAYDYSYNFAAKTDGVDHLLSNDQAACDRAGIADCQMVSLTSDADAEAQSDDKTLELRVSPAWLKAWQAGLTAELAQVHARLASEKVASEDLSLQIVDAQAHIKNKEALRDRLRHDIETQKAQLTDLTGLENQLSQIQEDIDASQSSLAVMNKRIGTIHLTLHYQADAVAASDDTFAPIGNAVKSSLGIFIGVVAGLISVVSAILPMALLGGLIALIILKTRKRKPAEIVENP